MSPGSTGITGSEELGDVNRAAFPLSTACFAGDQQSCEQIVGSLREYALSDGLSYTGNKNKNSSQFSDTRLEVNIAIKPMLGGYYFAKLRGWVAESDAQVIEPWVGKVVLFYNSYSRYFQDNHLTTAANVNAITGLILNDEDYIKRAEKQYRAAFDDMRSDGSLPVETERGSGAVAYTGLEISHLMALSEEMKSLVGNCN